MELEPTTECGKRLHNLLRRWISESPQAARNDLHRLFTLHAFKMENQATFLDALSGQGTLEDQSGYLV